MWNIDAESLRGGARRAPETRLRGQHEQIGQTEDEGDDRVGGVFCATAATRLRSRNAMTPGLFRSLLDPAATPRDVGDERLAGEPVLVREEVFSVFEQFHTVHRFLRNSRPLEQQACDLV